MQNVTANNLQVKKLRNGNLVNYVPKTYRHIMALATADTERIAFGAGYNSADIIDWSGTNGHLASSVVADVLGVQAVLLGASYAVPVLMTNTTQTVATAYNQFVTRGSVKVTKNDDTIQVSQLDELLPVLPSIAISGAGSAEVVTPLFERNGSIGDREAERKLGLYFRSPIRITRDTSFKLTFKFGAAPGASLNGYYLCLSAIVHEYPNNVPNPVRV